MDKTAQLDIRVVYDASSRRRASGATARVGGRPRRIGLVSLGLINLLVAGGLCYATWWPVDKFLYVNISLKTPLDIYLGDATLEEVAATMFGGLALNPASTGSEEHAPVETDRPSPTFVGKTAQTVIGLSYYAWLTLATLASCALALAGGAVFGRVGGSVWRLIGLVVSLTTAATLGWYAYSVWTQHHMYYPTDKLRAGMAGLVLVSALVGLAIGARVRGFSRMAAVMLLVSAIGSVVGLYLGNLAGAIESAQSSMLFLAFVFFVHSLWGWVLLLAGSRVRT